MKKYLLLLILLLFPLFSLGKEDVTIEKIDILEKSNEDILESISYNKLSINNNISFLNVGDFVQYEITINNPTSTDYHFNNDGLFLESNYFSYKVESNTNYIIKANSKTKMLMTVTYREEVEFDSDNSYTETNNIQVSLDEMVNHNPKTFTTIYYLMIIILILVVATFFLLYKKDKKTWSFIFIFSLFIPFLVFAYEELTITIHSEISVMKHNSEEIPENPQFCVVRGTTIDSEKDYYDFEEGMTTDDWNNSSYKTFNMTWDSFIQSDGTLTNVSEIGNTILDSSNGCYYNGTIITSVQVCTYSDDHYRASYITCLSDQTLGECLNSEETIYYYVPAFRTCAASVSINTDGMCNNIDHGSGKALSNCYSDERRLEVAPSELIVNYTDGCLSNIEIGSTYYCCLDGETELEVYDKKKKKRLRKKIKDITYDDLVLAWDFDKGDFIWVHPFWIMRPTEADKSIILSFSNGTILTVVGDHRIFSVEDGEFVSCEKCDIGITTFTSSGDKVQLVGKEIVYKKTIAYNLITYHHINVFANGILTSQGSNNLYPIESMKFVRDDRELFNTDDFENIPEEYLEGINLKEWDVKYNGSKEATREDMLHYVEKLLSLKK